MTRALSALLFVCSAAALSACMPSYRYTNEDVATVSKLGDLMWAQAQASDPAFKLIGKTELTDADYALATTAAERLKLTGPRTKMSFSKGPEWDTLCDAISAHADELGSAVAAKDVAKVNAALSATKDTCKTCHKKFR